MKIRRWLWAALGAFVVIFVSDMLIHGVWLAEFYKAHPDWWLSYAQMQARLGFMVGGQMVLAVLLVAVYSKGYEPAKGGLLQGIRFGFLIGLLLNVPMVLMLYSIYPYPASLLISWGIGGLAEITLAGGVIGLLYKPAK